MLPDLTDDKSTLVQIYSLRERAGDRLIIKMPSYQYRDSHVKDKTGSPTALSLTSPYLEKTVFILRRGPGRDTAGIS